MSRLTLIARAVAKETGVSVELLLSGRRAKPIARARHMAWLIASELTTLSLPKIAGGFGKKEHTAVMHGIRRAKHFCATEPEFAARYAAAKAAAQRDIKDRIEMDNAVERAIAALTNSYAQKLRHAALADRDGFLAKHGERVGA